MRPHTHTQFRFPFLSSVLYSNYQNATDFAFSFTPPPPFALFLIVPSQGYVLVSGRHWSRHFTKLAAYLFVKMLQWVATFWLTIIGHFFLLYIYIYIAFFFASLLLCLFFLSFLFGSPTYTHQLIVKFFVNWWSNISSLFGLSWWVCDWLSCLA